MNIHRVSSFFYWFCHFSVQGARAYKWWIYKSILTVVSVHSCDGVMVKKVKRCLNLFHTCTTLLLSCLFADHLNSLPVVFDCLSFFTRVLCSCSMLVRVRAPKWLIEVESTRTNHRRTYVRRLGNDLKFFFLFVSCPFLMLLWNVRGEVLWNDACFRWIWMSQNCFAYISWLNVFLVSLASQVAITDQHINYPNGHSLALLVCDLSVFAWFEHHDQRW